MRTPVIAGNWKMNMTVAEAVRLVNEIRYGLRNPGNVDVVVAPPSTAIFSVASLLKDSYIGVAAQNIHWEESGAFTGEVAAMFVKEAGADYVIIGHSERRQYFGETDETVNKKIKSALKNNLTPIVCVGETLDEREAGRADEVIKRQIADGLAGLTENEAAGLLIAYEPVWAIGTGKTATPEEAEAVHAMIRNFVAAEFSRSATDTVRILYGGSMKPSNCRELLRQPDIDGGLIGGASLKADDFIEIINGCYKILI